MKIPLFDLKRQYGRIAADVRRAVCRVLDSGAYILGAEGRGFEADFSRAIGCRHVIGVSSGTAALRVALKAVGVGPGDDVIVPAHTFVATATAVSETGARPVLADVDPETLTLGEPQLRAALTPRVRAAIPVHLYGYPADMDPIMALARKRGFKVLEDCAQGHLTAYKGRPAGSLGDLSAFSFYPTKNLGAAGDAGAVATQDDALAQIVLRLRNVGRAPRDSNRHEIVGYNSRLDEVQAAVLRVKLKHLERWIGRRRKLAALYDKGLAGLPVRTPPRGSGGTLHAYSLYVVRLDERDALAQHLAREGVGTGVYYPLPLHLQPAYRDLGYKEGAFPQAEQAARTGLALPIFPELREDEVRTICEAVKSFFA